MNAVSGADAPVTLDVTEGGIDYQVTNFFGDSAAVDDGPQGFLVAAKPHDLNLGQDAHQTMVAAHFHLVRQYQVVVGGGDPRIGKHSVDFFDFHYTDPSTPYGPIDSNADGVEFFTLRPRAETGAYYMPGNREKMTARAGRN